MPQFPNYKRAKINGMSESKYFDAQRLAIYDRLEQRVRNSQDLLAGLALEAMGGVRESLQWENLTNSMRCRMHNLIDEGYVKIYARKISDYQTSYFVKITDEGLAKAITEGL